MRESLKRAYINLFDMETALRKIRLEFIGTRVKIVDRWSIRRDKMLGVIKDITVMPKGSDVPTDGLLNIKFMVHPYEKGSKENLSESDLHRPCYYSIDSIDFCPDEGVDEDVKARYNF